MFRIFVSFSLFSGFKVQETDVKHLLAFLEFLQFNGVSASSMKNYISAIKAKFSTLGLSVIPFSDIRLKYFTKAICSKG